MDVPGDRTTIALARFPSLVRDAARDFQRLTGLTVVTTLGLACPDKRPRRRPSPPVHPLCAKLLRRSPENAPCDAEWRKHLRSAEKMSGCRIHTCPLGLRCAGVPIVLGDELLGLAKCVSGPEISPKRFRSFVAVLEAMIARPSQDLHVFLLRERIDSLQTAVNQLHRAKRPAWPAENNSSAPATEDPTNHHPSHAQTLTRQVLDYLNKHYDNSELSLIQVAKAVGKNEKYISHLFVQQIGERMRPFITKLRVRRACDLLLQTSWTIEQIAHDSGFARAVHFRESFRRIVGLTASEYRQIFTAGAAKLRKDFPNFSDAPPTVVLTAALK